MRNGVVYRSLPDDLPQRGLCCILERPTVGAAFHRFRPGRVAGVGDVEEERAKVPDAVLNNEADGYDVQVARNHLGLAHFIRDDAGSPGPEAKLHAPGLFDGDDVHRADGRRRVPVESLFLGAAELAEETERRLLGRLHGVEAGAEPEGPPQQR